MLMELFLPLLRPPPLFFPVLCLMPFAALPLSRSHAGPELLAARAGGGFQSLSLLSHSCLQSRLFLFICFAICLFFCTCPLLSAHCFLFLFPLLLCLALIVGTGPSPQPISVHPGGTGRRQNSGDLLEIRHNCDLLYEFAYQRQHSGPAGGFWEGCYGSPIIFSHRNLSRK